MTIGQSPIGGGVGGPRVFAGTAKKLASEPIFMINTGQSNSTGQNVAATYPMPINPEVFDWQAPTGSTSYSFVVADPARVFSEPGGTYTVGMPGNGKGHIGWAAANIIQKATGRRVYMLNIGRTNTVASAWAVAGSIYVGLAAQIGPAMAAAGVTKVDLLIWLQGESDKALGTPSDVYATAVDAILTTDAVTGGWSTANHTHNIICDLGPGWGPWNGPAELAQALNPYSTFISTQSRADDGVHYLGDDTCRIGEDCARAFLSGPLQSVAKSRNVYTRLVTGATVATATLLLEQAVIGTGQLVVSCKNAAGTKYYTALVMYHYYGTGKLGAVVVQTAGEAGFAFTMTDFGGLFGVLTCAGTAGETWHWSIAMVKPPSVYTP